MERELISTNELAEVLGVHKQTIYGWAREGMPRKKMGYNLVRYDLEKVLEWLEERNDKDD